jgi:NTE family protein
VSSFLNGICKGAYWSVRSRIADFNAPGALPCPEARAAELAQVATRLADMPEHIQKRLINWGYVVRDAAMRRWVDPGLPAPTAFPYARGV